MSKSISLKQIEYSAIEYDWITGYLGELGLNNGNTEMKVDGSITPVHFYIQADPTKDTIITKAKLQIYAVKHDNNTIGEYQELTNGIDMYYNKGENNIYQLEAAKNNGDLILQSGNTDNFTHSINWNIIPTNSDLNNILIITLDFKANIGGLTLKAGTTNKLEVKISDNLTLAGNDKLTSIKTQIFAAREE